MEQRPLCREPRTGRAIACGDLFAISRVSTKNNVSRHYLNLTASAYRQLRRNWHLPASPMLLWQSLVPGSLFSAMSALQAKVTRAQLAQANYRNAIVVLGYW